MEKVNVYVSEGNRAAVTCPYCQKTYDVTVEKYKGLKHSLVTRCSACKKQFGVELNFRRYYRKPVKLVGEALNLSTGAATPYTVSIVNISMIGLRLSIIGRTDINKGNRLRVSFTLDNQRARRIEKDVRVIDINGDHYGCEFLNLAYEKELGFYLFSS